MRRAVTGTRHFARTVEAIDHPCRQRATVAIFNFSIAGDPVPHPKRRRLINGSAPFVESENPLGVNFLGKKMISKQGMTEFVLTNVESGEIAKYVANDILCAKMLAADDHGGEPEDWLTEEEARDADDERE